MTKNQILKTYNEYVQEHGFHPSHDMLNTEYFEFNVLRLILGKSSLRNAREALKLGIEDFDSTRDEDQKEINAYKDIISKYENHLQVAQLKSLNKIVNKC